MLRLRRYDQAISLQWGPFDPTFHVEGVAPSTKHSSCRKTGLSCGIRMRAQLSFVLSQITKFDRETDGQTDRQNSHRYRPCLHSMQRGIKNHALDYLERNPSIHPPPTLPMDPPLLFPPELSESPSRQ